MSKTLTFLHTSAAHITTFDALVNGLVPDIPVEHIVAETLLQDAIDQGQINAELAE